MLSCPDIHVFLGHIPIYSPLQLATVAPIVHPTAPIYVAWCPQTSALFSRKRMRLDLEQPALHRNFSFRNYTLLIRMKRHRCRRKSESMQRQWAYILFNHSPPIWNNWFVQQVRLPMHVVDRHSYSLTHQNKRPRNGFKTTVRMEDSIAICLLSAHRLRRHRRL